MTRSLVAGFVAIAALSTVAAREASADFCLIGAGGVKYQLQYGTANPASGTPAVVTGKRVIAQFQAAVFGTLFVKNGTTLVIGLNEAFDFGSGAWTHPNGTTVFTFPPAGGGVPMFDTTYHGNGAPYNVTGSLTVTSCPVATTASLPAGAAGDPDTNLAPGAEPKP